MDSFEKKYYEASSFWENGMLEDENNKHRIITTGTIIPDDVTTLADIGCGNGIFLNYLAAHKPELDLLGVDRSEKALSFVKAKKSVGDASALPLENLSFDCVSCLEVIEHLPIAAYEKTLNELTRIAKKYLIISVPFNETIEDSYTKCPSCKSIFNYEFHLRSFNEENFTKLFNERGFKNVQVVKAGYSAHYKFHDAYRKMFYPEQFLKWNSPICPFCGYEEAEKIGSNKITAIPADSKRKLVSYLSALPKLIWPKEKKPYWIIGLFERTQ